MHVYGEERGWAYLIAEALVSQCRDLLINPLTPDLYMKFTVKFVNSILTLWLP